MQTSTAPVSENKSAIFGILYALVAGVQLWTRLFPLEDELPAMVSKSLLMPLLFLYYWTNRPEKKARFHILVFLALLFSFSGDVWLMFEGGATFLLGLGSFLVTHLLYIVIFSPGTAIGKQKTYLREKPQFILPFLLFAFVLLKTIYPGLGSMKIPVIVYASIICLMSLVALNRKGRVAQRSFVLVLIGAVLFMISDSLIALEKFATGIDSFASLPFWVMLTYALAQFLIVWGLIEETRPQIGEQV